MVYTLFRDCFTFSSRKTVRTFSFLNSVNISSHLRLMVDSLAIPSTYEKEYLFYEHQFLFQ